MCNHEHVQVSSCKKLCVTVCTCNSTDGDIEGRDRYILGESDRLVYVVKRTFFWSRDWHLRVSSDLHMYPVHEVCVYEWHTDASAHARTHTHLLLIMIQVSLQCFVGEDWELDLLGCI